MASILVIPGILNYQDLKGGQYSTDPKGTPGDFLPTRPKEEENWGGCICEGTSTKPIECAR